MVTPSRTYKAEGRAERSQEDTWQPLASIYEITLRAIGESIGHIEKLTRWNAHQDEVQRLQTLLSLNIAGFKEEARLPCITLPVSRNARFFDREPILERIHSIFHDESEHSRFRSMALYGLGGVGKSTVAMKYAQRFSADLDAILWIRSETATSLEDSFSGAALRLQLPGATPQKHEENRILVLDWLQRTGTSWIHQLQELLSDIGQRKSGY